MRKISRIALISGSGRFPLFLARAARANGIEVIAMAIKSAADKQIAGVADKVYWVDIGQAKRLIELFAREKIKYAVMAGKVNKAAVIRQALRLDEEAKSLFKKLRNRKDDTILSAIASRFKDFGITLIDSTLFLKDLMPQKGLLTGKRPGKRESADIKFGFSIAKDMGELDIGQSVAVKDKAVIAVEAIEGTDEAIRRAGKLAGEGVVVVKVAKPKQDMRFDVPTVGLETIKALREAKASVLAIEAEKVLVLDRDEMINKADRADISVVAV